MAPTVQDWVVHDTLTITGLRTGGVGEGDDPAAVTFRLYDYDPVAETCSADPIAESEVIDLPLDGTTASTETGVAVTEAGYYYVAGNLQRRPVQRGLHDRLR